ncbi:MAG: hypothetical protein PVJ21_10200 [Anaerolineales bacterium]|jgi:hypothetical protein
MGWTIDDRKLFYHLELSSSIIFPSDDLPAFFAGHGIDILCRNPFNFGTMGSFTIARIAGHSAILVQIV